MALRFMILVAGVGTFTLMGCGETGPPTFPVTGTVTMGGSPVEGAVVTFTSATGGAGAVGVSDASGKYELTTKSKGDGAIVGKFKVTIAKYDGPTDEGAAAAPSDVDVTAEDFDEYASVEGYDEGEGEAAPSKNLLPEKYASADTSGFEADVVAGDNSFDFALEGAGGAAAPTGGEGEEGKGEEG